MQASLLQRLFVPISRRRLPSKLSPLLLLLQRSPLVKLLPEARVISTSGFSDVFTWAVTAVAGLGAYDSVSGATAVVQTAPAPNSATVPTTGGASLAFLFQITGAGGHTPATFQVIGSLPPGLTLTGKKNSTTDSITGKAIQTGNFPITVRAWENSDNTGRYADGAFTIAVAAPPAPAITAQPAGGNFTPGQIAKLAVTATSAYTYTWKRNGTALPVTAATLFSRTASRRFFSPSADTGTAWRTDPAFNDAAWSVTAGGIGYDTGSSPTYLPHITGNTGSGKASVYLRIPFTLENPLALSYLNLKAQSDDGFIAYLNGTEVASFNKPATVAWNSVATAAADEAGAVLFKDNPINQHLHLLKAGANLLAVQVLNEAASSSDLLFNCELTGGIDATNSSRLVLAGLRPQDAGAYSVTVTNSTGNVTSAAANIVLAPSIDTQPASVTIDAGLTASLSVTSSTSPAPAYQWYQGQTGDTSHPVAGATGSTFTTPALTATTTYWVRLTNGAGTMDSATATVTVLAAPPGIATQPASVTIPGGSSTTLQVVASGTGPFTYAWFTGSSGDTSSPVAGATADTFTTPALQATTLYWVRVTNPAASVNSATATVTVLDDYNAWKAAAFLPAEAASPAISGPAADPDGDGISNEREYAFGSLPKSPNPLPAPVLTAGAGAVTLSFPAVSAAGPGYAGRTRHYAIETAAGLGAGPWTALAGYADITAAGQTVTASLPVSGASRFCRLKVWLTP